MRYDEDLTVEAVTNWALQKFKNVFNVYNFNDSFIVLTTHEIIVIRKNCGTVEIRNK